MEWQGFYDFSHNPKEYNPQKGYVTSWNNKAYAGLRSDSSNFSYVDRVNELIEPLESKAKLSQQEIWEINKTAAWSDLNARYFVPYMVKAAQSPKATPLAKKSLPYLPVGILNYALIARRNIIKVQHQQLRVHGLIK